MGFIVYIGTVSKRLNSTAVPDTTGWHSVDAVWKKDKDLDSPSIEMYLPDVESPDYNYMYIPSQKAYYWITGFISVGAKRWVATAGMDLLATYRGQILATSALIEYGTNSNSGAADLRVTDSRQTLQMKPEVYTQVAEICGAKISWTSGVYILSCVGAHGGLTAYMLTGGALKRLLNRISQDITDAIADLDYTEIIRYFSASMLSQGSAASAIRSCSWLPLSYTLYSTGDTQEIYLGDYATGVSGKVVENNQLYFVDTKVPIPWPVDDWRRNCCQINVYVPFDGTIAIPVQQCNHADSLDVRWCVELITGGTSVRINAGDYTVHTSSGNLGVPYGIGVSNVPLQNFISGAFNAVGGYISAGAGVAGMAQSALTSWATLSLPDIGALGKSAAGVVGSWGQAASGAMQALTPVMQGAGTLGGSAAVGQHSSLEMTLLYYPPLDPANFSAKYGYPVFKIGTPSAGYCKTSGFSLAAPARADELARINAAMDGGVFIE